MNTLLFSLFFCLALNKAHGIYGGCMSYSSSQSNVSGHIKVKLYFLNGWKLNRGPCYNCTENDEGSDVTDRRNQFINDTNDPEAFGIWSFEEEESGAETSVSKNITLKVNERIRDVVLMVNKHEGWSWESSEIHLLLAINTSKHQRFDIMFSHFNDGYLTDMGQDVTVFLQVKVNPYKRSDTGKPNNSPVVLAKPYYSLELGKMHAIHIPTIDIEDDIARCVFSDYVEAGAFLGLVKNLSRSSIVKMKEMECVLTINLNNTRFKVGDTFALPVTIKDYSRIDIFIRNLYSPYRSPIGRSTLLMFFEVTGRTDPPKFISPTPLNNQEYTIFLGGYLHISVYAKPTDNARKIKKINFLRHDGVYMTQTEVLPVFLDPNAAYSTMSWTPANSDLGFHLVCANAEDTNGISTVDLHCFRVIVKAYPFRPNPPTPGKPYFVSFPKPTDIRCGDGTYCIIPIYAATNNVGGIKSINSTEMTKENIQIQHISDIRNGTKDIKVSQMEFFGQVTGLRQICLNTSDSFAWTVSCLFIHVQEQDPCESRPCQNNGRCTHGKNHSGFVCICTARHEGLLCEKEKKFCPGPCFDSTNCQEVDLPPFFLCFQCPSGKTGDLCNVDIHVTKSSVVPTLAPTILNTTTGPILIAPSEKPVMDSVQERPYFVHFPQQEGIICVQDHICNFSVYASTPFCRDITEIENMPISDENVTIYTSSKMVGMTVTKKGDIQFFPKQFGQRRICLKASDCISFIHKCFYITVLKNNPCESSPCQHRGECSASNVKTKFNCSCRYGYSGKLCETKTRPCMVSDTCVGGSTCVPVRSEPFFRCICPSGKTGVRCDVDDGYREQCDNSSICRNNAACHSVNQPVLCVCRLGYKGPTCSIEANDHLRSPTNTGAKFTDTALPKSVICYVAFPCPIPFTVTKNIFNKPSVALGYSDPLLHVTSLELQHTAPLGGVVHGLLEVVGNSQGSASICLQSIDKAWRVRIEDEICFHVEVRNGGYYKKYSDVPHFVQPTFETDSLFECLVGDSCHFNLWAVNDIRENNCPVLRSEGIRNLYLFIMSPLNQTLSPCVYDVSLKADTPTNATACFYLEGDAGVKYDRRCYTVQASNLNKKGSCAGGLCYNGGFCDGHKSTKNCLCPLGFSGENCTIDHGIPQAVNQHAINNPLFENMLVPKQVICPLKEKCNIQFLLSSRKVFNIDIKIDPSSIEIKEKEEVRVSKDFLVTLTIVHKHTGSHRLCLNLTSENHSLVTDRFCCDIFTEETVTSNGDACVSDSSDDCKNPSALKFICSDPTTAEYCRKSCKLCDKQTKEETEQLFIPPSPTNTSAYSCSPGLECHMMLYLKRGYNNLCPEVSVIPSVGASVHVFNNSDCNVCSVDVLIKLSLSHPGQRLQQCLQATDYDFGSTERRCYFLENVQHTSP